MTEPVISIIMTVYNGERFLDEAISSVLTQPFKDFELIVVNDGSTDNSGKIIASLAANDKRIVSLTNEANIKQPLSRNRAINIARGKYISILDADDICLPERFETQSNFLEQNPEITLVGTGAYIIDASGKITGKKYKPIDTDNMKYRLLFHNPIIHSSVMVRKEALKSVGGFDPNYPHTEDLQLYSALVGAGYKITNLDKLLIKYRQSPQSVSIATPTRKVQLDNARLIGFNNVAKYHPVSFDDYCVAFNTLNLRPIDFKSMVKTMKLYGDITNTYLKKEELTGIVANEIKKIHDENMSHVWKRYFKQLFKKESN